MGAISPAPLQIAATAPVTIGGTANAPNVAMGAATAGANGYATAAQIAKLDGIQAGAIAGVPKDVGAQGIGMIAMCGGQSFSSIVVASGETVGGASIGISKGAGVGPNLTGTWRNISNYTLDQANGPNLAAFQRIA